MAQLLKIKVLPGSEKEAIIKGDPLIIKVRQPAQRGLANKAVIRLLSKYFGSRTRIVKGGKSPNKIVEIS